MELPEVNAALVGMLFPHMEASMKLKGVYIFWLHRHPTETCTSPGSVMYHLVLHFHVTNEFSLAFENKIVTPAFNLLLLAHRSLEKGAADCMFTITLSA